MNHQQAEELFLEFLDHRISEVDGRLLATHLDRCEQCREALVEYREVMRLERVIAGEAHLIGPLFGEEVMESIERERTHMSVESSRKAPQSKSSGTAHFWGAVSVITVVAMLVFAVYALNSIGTTPDTDYQTRQIVGTVFKVIEGAGGATVMLLAALIGVVAFIWPHRSWRRRFAYCSWPEPRPHYFLGLITSPMITPSRLLNTATMTRIQTLLTHSRKTSALSVDKIQASTTVHILSTVSSLSLRSHCPHSR